MINHVAGFSLLVGLGVAFGLTWSVTQNGSRNAERMLTLGVVILLSALTGSRIYYVILHWGYYHLRLLDAIWVWEGGLSGSGALMGGCIGLWLAARAAQISPGNLADQFFPLLASLVVAGWLASWLAGSAYGALSNAWWALPSRDEWGVSSFRVPVQFMGAVSSALCLGWLEQQRQRFKRAGMAASLGLCTSAMILFGLSTLRADSMPVWAGMRMDAWGALTALATAIVFTIFNLLPWRVENP